MIMIIPLLSIVAISELVELNVILGILFGFSNTGNVEFELV